VKRPLRAALLSIPLTAAGSLLAHALAYRVAVPDGQTRAQLYRETGHGYLAYAPTFFAVCLAVVFGALVVLALRFAQGHGRTQVAAWPFAVLPLLMFTIQEHAERFVHTGHFPFGAALEPTFLPGLWFQVPLALAMYLVARAVLRLAEGLGRILAGTTPVEPVAAKTPIRFLLASCELPRLSPLARRCAGRAPPPLSFAH
jgi:hypothetical protein